LKKSFCQQRPSSQLGKEHPQQFKHSKSASCSHPLAFAKVNLVPDFQGKLFLRLIFSVAQVNHSKFASTNRGAFIHLAKVKA